MRIMKLLLTMFLMVFVFSANVTHTEAANKVSIYIYNDETQYYNNQGIIEKGTTLVPLRGIFEALGATVQWDQKSKTIQATKGETTIWLKIGSKTAEVNGKTISISVPAQIKENLTYVPLRFISESLGEKVHWDDSTRTVIIGSDDQGIYKQYKQWLGLYNNPWFTGSGALTDLYVYKVTPDSISFVSQTGYRYDPTGGLLAGYQMPWEYIDYYGEANLISDTSASFSSGGCEAIFELVDTDIRVHQTSQAGSCNFTGLGIYSGDDNSAYKK